MTDANTGGRDLWHVPVMTGEVISLLVTESTGVMVDCTVGTGGHAETMLRAAPESAVLVGLDLDRDALQIAKRRLAYFGDRVILKHMNFKDLGKGLPIQFMGKVDALLIDCGISRLQIVQPERGFSFDREGAMDMRFDKSDGVSAKGLLDEIGVEELGRMLWLFGEKARCRKIARAIIRERDAGRLATTADLAGAVKSVVHGRAAKSLARVFLAIRARVNQELENLAEALGSLPDVLASGGRAAVIAYHGTEDRVVKQYFRKFSGRCICPPGRLTCDCGKERLFKVLTPKPVAPSAGEIERNPASRSARIRVVEKM
jgi:16S rRNA (cytosine1402-N4)-methyltransferase